jgi:hypothetical protein
MDEDHSDQENGERNQMGEDRLAVKQRRPPRGALDPDQETKEG